MSILSQNSLRKTSAESRRSQEAPKAKEVPEKDFKELLRAQQISEETRKRNFFALMTEDEEEERENHKALIAGAIDSAPSPALLTQTDSVSLSSIAAAKTTELSAEIELLFEKMASCMIVMQSSHEAETTLVLEGPGFASSSLFGTQITVREFSTAPKIFNVEILAGAHAAAIIESNKKGLLSHFENGNFNFSVHRLDTHISKDAWQPLFHRKESKDGKGDQSP